MKCPIVIGDQPLLRTISKPVENQKELWVIKPCIDEYLNSEEILGISAPQLFYPIRIIGLNGKLLGISKGPIILPNPQIIQTEGEELDIESCLSFPELFLAVKRAKKVIVKALDENFEEIILQAEGLFARVLQHEIDHLDGKLFIDKYYE